MPCPSIVPPSTKCRGCLHHDEGRTTCEVGLHPHSCGEGSYPEMGYAPIIGSEQNLQDLAHKSNGLRRR